MRLPVCFVIVGILARGGALPDSLVLAGQSVAPRASASRPTPQAIETFLLKARITSTRSACAEVTDSRRATLTDGVLTHDAQIRP